MEGNKTMELQPKQIFVPFSYITTILTQILNAYIVGQIQPLYTDQFSCLPHSTTDQISLLQILSSLLQSLFSYLDFYVISIIT